LQTQQPLPPNVGPHSGDAPPAVQGSTGDSENNHNPADDLPSRLVVADKSGVDGLQMLGRRPILAFAIEKGVYPHPASEIFVTASEPAVPVTMEKGQEQEVQPEQKVDQKQEIELEREMGLELEACQLATGAGRRPRRASVFYKDEPVQVDGEVLSDEEAK